MRNIIKYILITFLSFSLVLIFIFILPIILYDDYTDKGKDWNSYYEEEKINKIVLYNLDKYSGEKVFSISNVIIRSGDKYYDGGRYPHIIDSNEVYFYIKINTTNLNESVYCPKGDLDLANCGFKTQIHSSKTGGLMKNGAYSIYGSGFNISPGESNYSKYFLELSNEFEPGVYFLLITFNNFSDKIFTLQLENE